MTSEAALNFRTDTGEVHHAQLANLAAMARSIFHQVGTTEVADPALTTLVNFNGSDGSLPEGSLMADAHGNLFGTTTLGGTHDVPGGSGEGTVFEIVKTAHGYASTPTTLVDFNGTDGQYPEGSLIADSHGDLFGTTFVGGANGAGTVFELANTPHGYASTPTTLVSSFNFFDSPGYFPLNLIADAHGNLLGTNIINGYGALFEIAKTAHGYASTPTTLVSFDGEVIALIADSQGNLFGTTYSSAANKDGTVFEVAKTAHGYASTPTTLVSFDGRRFRSRSFRNRVRPLRCPVTGCNLGVEARSTALTVVDL
jgi:uncharacterized repeat protein (TIGR03803 family)